MQVDNTDSASLHFESILEGDLNQDADVSSSEASSHPFLFDIHSENYDIPRVGAQSAAMAAYENTDVNNDIERKKRPEFAHKFPNHVQPKSELTNNSLFIKFRESADGCTTSPSDSESQIPHREDNVHADETSHELPECSLKDSNSVSCEDLLEFANKKPKGKERGVESDEVRIMTKVLGTSVSISR